MTRSPSDPPGSSGSKGVADRLAGALRRHLLAAAQVSLRAIREILAQLPAPEGETDRPATREFPTARSPVVDDRASSVSQNVSQNLSRPRKGVLPDPPPAELLRTQAPLPDSYGSNRLVLLSRDPHCLYAYWDLSDAHRRQVRNQAGSTQLRTVLRAYDVTQISFDAKPPTRFQDFMVTGDAPSVYAYVGKPAACFVAEVGYLRSDGAFFPLARSQPVWTPRTDRPGTAPARWMTVGRSERSEAGTVGWSERGKAGEVVPLTTTGAGALDVEPSGTPAPSLRAPSSWAGRVPSADQRGSWSLVRGKLATAPSPDDPPRARSEP